MGTALSAGRIAVVDDDPTIRSFFTTLLTDYGYQPSAWPDSSETWCTLRRERPDLLILNLGYHVRATIGELEELLLSTVCTLQIPIVLMSTDHVFLDRHADVLTRLCSAKIAMPFDVSAFLATVSALLRQPMPT